MADIQDERRMGRTQSEGDKKSQSVVGHNLKCFKWKETVQLSSRLEKQTGKSRDHALPEQRFRRRNQWGESALGGKPKLVIDKCLEAQ